MRAFNTAGPCKPGLHYMVDPLARSPEVRRLAEGGHYFAIHAPRQTGKTTLLLALAKAMTAEGRFAAVYLDCQGGEALGEDVGAVEDAILAGFRALAGIQLPVELRPPSWPDMAQGNRVFSSLMAWARACPRPLVLFLDEIDALRGEALRAVLRQLRMGFPHRPSDFPHSVVLCGLRDVRDYKAASGGEPERLGTSSPFNVKVESLRLGDFARGEIEDLVGQHAAETGQVFETTAIDRLEALSGGQPWLVNALCREVVEKMGLGPAEPIAPEHLDEAKERLVLARQTHLDSLVARLQEPRVRRVLLRVLDGDSELEGDTYDDDVSYVRDLGLVKSKPLRISNPIYREVIVRVLAGAAEDAMTVEPRTFVRDDGTLDVRRILTEFLEFWREHGDVLAAGMPYHEVAPQLVLMAWLQRIVNGGGHIDREYGVGKGRIDLLVRWPVPGPGGRREVQREALELKVWRDGKPDPIEKGLVQIDGYLGGLGLSSGVLVLFDRRSGAHPLSERCGIEEAETPSGRKVTVVRA